jgi:hypothetical protein
VSSTIGSLQTDDVAAVLAMSAYERAASAVATAMTELADTGVATDRVTAIVLKHFLAHFSGLQHEFEEFLRAMDLDADLAPSRASN